MDIVDYALQCVGMNEIDRSFRVIIDGYNTLHPLPRAYRMKYTDEWCMAAVSYWAMRAGLSDAFPYECSCAKAIAKLQDNKLWKEDDTYEPERGDLIFYHWNHTDAGDCTHTPNHVGVVVKTKNGQITVCEGNYNEAVKMRTVPADWKYIRGFGLTSGLAKSGLTDYTQVAMQVVAGKWGNQPERQKLLEAAGYNYETVRSYVNSYYKKEGAESPNLTPIEEIVLEVIRGEWGNEPERSKKLIAAGYDYEAVRELVNEYYERGGT